jgi:IclR family KDG regulon transcriptional repressor
MTVGELDEGAAAVAAPILDRRGRLVAGLSIAGPAQRLVPGAGETTAAVTAAAARIERAYQAQAEPPRFRDRRSAPIS